MSREHIWADWLREYIPRDMDGYTAFTATEYRTHSTFSYKRRSGDLRARRVRCVCVTCNNVWMSQIQTKVKPTAIPLIQGRSITISAAERATLAGWIAMAVVTVDQLDRKKSAITQADRDYIRKHRYPPPSWHIWIGDYERKVWKNYLGRHHLVITEDLPGMENVRPMSPNTQTTTYIAGRLFIHTMTCQLPGITTEWDFDGVPTPYLRTLWPTDGISFAWPPPVMEDADAAFIGSAFYNAVKRISTRAY